MSVAVTSAGGKRPVVVLSGLGDTLSEPLARAGFMTVAFQPSGAEELHLVLDALEQGALGPDAPGRALVERAADGALVITRIRAGSPLAAGPEWTVRDASPERAFRAVIEWLTKHIA